MKLKVQMTIFMTVVLAVGFVGGMFFERSLSAEDQTTMEKSAIEKISIMKDFCREEIQKCNDQLDSLYIVTTKATTNSEFDQIETSLSQIQANRITYKGALKGLEIAESFLE